MRFRTYQKGGFLPVALTALCMLYSNVMFGNVMAPLQVGLQAPEEGFHLGSEAEISLSVWIPAVGDNEASSVELTLNASGVARISGQKRWVINKPPIGEPQRVTAVVRIEGPGQGEWVLEAASFNADGERLWGAAATLFVLQTSDEILHGKSSGFHLLQEKLEKDRAKGVLNEKKYKQEQERLLRGEELELQKELKGLSGEDAPPQAPVKAVVDTTLVSGRIVYTHRTGRNAGANVFASAADARPLTSMLVEFYDKVGAAATKLATVPAEVRTDASGNYTNVSVPGKRGDETAVNLEVRFVFDSPAATIRPSVAGDVSYIAAPVLRR